MADLCVAYTINGIVINNTTPNSDRLLTDFEGGAISGLDGAPIRKQIDPQGQSDGGIVHPAFFGPRIIRFDGAVNIQSVADIGGNMTAYLTALNTLEASVVSALQGILNTPSSLSWTPTGLTGHSINVTYGTEGGEIQFSGNMLERKFSFTLVAAEPTITVA